MFEHEIDTIIATSRARVPHSISNPKAIVLKDVLAADIPQPLKTFFRGDIELMLGEELREHRKNSRFNFDHPDVHGLERELNSILVLHYVFERDEFYRRLEDAVHLLVNYLVRPQWTLTNVFFEKESEVSSISVMRLLRQFGAYEYLRSLILRYIENRKIERLDKEQFSVILRKLDGEYIRRKTGGDIAKIIAPLYDFLEYPQRTGDSAIATKGLIKYFEDKGFKGVTRRLQIELSAERLALRAIDLGNILDDLRKTSAAFEIDLLIGESSEPEETEMQPEPTPPEPAEEPVFETAPHTPSFIESLGVTPEPRAEEVAPLEENPIPQEEPVEPAETETISLPTPPTSSLPALALAMSDGDKKKFIKRIFQQDEQQFLDALRKIDQLLTWRQASVFIDEIFIANDVDPYSSEAIRFIDVIEEKYYPKK